MTRRKKAWVAAWAFVIAVVAARMAAPHYVLKYVNKTLDGLDGYSGHVGGIDLHIWRGAYEIEDVAIVKTHGTQSTPFVAVKKIDISVQWGALLDGSLVGEIELEEPTVNFVAEKKKESAAEDQREKREAKKATTGDSSWQTQVKELVPLKINRVGVTDGEIHYRDRHADPQVDIYVQNFHGELTNLTNSEDLSEDMVATARFRGMAMGSGKLSLDARVDPYTESPTFTLDAKLENLQMKQLNKFLKAYANVDAERGRISVYTEFACANGRFKGYVKPLIRDLRLLRWKDETEGPLNKIWEGMVEVASELFEHHGKEQIATKIPLSGRLDSPDADIFTTVIYVLKNAFIEALERGIERSVGMENAITAAKEDE